MLNEEQIWNFVDIKKADFIALSDRVFETPETLYNEYASVAEHVAALNAEGFTVTEGICGMPTAVMGEAGTEGPVIAILGEFDALPGLSQQPGVAEHSPLEAGGNGHGCGHNLLGAAALLAATAVKTGLPKIILKRGFAIMAVRPKKAVRPKPIWRVMDCLMMLLRQFHGTPQPLMRSSMDIHWQIRG